MINRFKPTICGDGFCGATDCARCYPQFIHKPTDIVLLTCPTCKAEFDMTLGDIAEYNDEVMCPFCDNEFVVPDVLWE